MVGRFFYSLLILILLFPALSIAQSQTDYNWYFGDNSRAILFNRGGNNEPRLDSLLSPPFATGGSAVASDPVNGDLLFFASGTTIFDQGLNPMFGTSALNGDPNENQPVGISPIPGTTDQYYVFTVNGGFIEFSVVDMSLTGNGPVGSGIPFGEVVSGPTPTPIASVNPNIAIVHRIDSINFLIVQDAVSREIESYRINAGNNFVPVSTLTLPATFDVQNFAFSTANNQIAISPTDPNTRIHLIGIDPGTGTLTYNRSLPNSGFSDPTLPGIYDTEWSNNGQFLYVSRHGDASQVANIFQINVNDTVATPQPLLLFPVNRSFGLKTGPDGRVYHLFQENPGDPIRLARINSPDSVRGLVDYELDPLGNFNFVAQQFPEISAGIIPPLDIGIVFFDSCFNTTTKFFPIFAETPESFDWQFGDGGTSTLVAPIYTYQAPGSYTVSLTARINGTEETATRQVDIINNDLEAQLQDTTICPGDVITLDPMAMGGSGSLTYRWNTNETTATISIDSAGTYWVVVTDAISGCTFYTSANVTVVGDENQRANIWFFGQNAGIDFNEQPAVAISNASMDAPEGTSTISDDNGDVLFFTDGESVFNRLDAPMSNGTNIGGETGATQSSIIVPFPGDETLYYIFLTEEVYGSNTYRMKYAVVDIKGDNGLGSVRVKDTVYLFENSTERVTASNNWVVAHEYGNNNFRAYPITPQGIAPPIITSIGSTHAFSDELQGRGYMKLNAAADRLAVAVPSSGGNNAVELFSFADSTGEISDYIRLELQNFQPYGIEFSPGGNKLVVSANDGGNSIIYEFRIDSLNQDFINSNRGIVNNSNTGGQQYGAIQRGPDGQIYMAIDGASALATISISEDTATTSNSTMTPDGFPLLGGTTSRLGLPNFIQSLAEPPRSPSFAVVDGCTNEELQFSATEAYQNDSFLWDFGDSTAFSTEQNPTHAYTAGGTYLVTLRVSRCEGNPLLADSLEVDILTDTVVITDPPTPPSIDRAQVLCDQPPLLLDGNNGEPGLLYEWRFNDVLIATTDTVSVTRPGRYNLTISTPQGCSIQDSVEVAPALTFDLGPDVSICQNDALTLNTLIAGLPTQWTANGVVVGNAQTQIVDSSIPDTVTYIARIEDTFSAPGCFVFDTVIVTINEIPVTDPPVITNAPTCGGTDGVVDLNITSVGTFAINWLDSSNTVIDTDAQLNNVGAGVYRAEVTNVITGCVTTVPVTLSDVAYTVAAINMDACATELTDVTVAVSGFLTPNVDFTLSDLSGAVVASGNVPVSGGNIIIPQAPTGTFNLLVAEDSPNFCSASNSFVLNPLDSIDFSIIVDICDISPAGVLTLEARPADASQSYVFEWSTLDGNISSATNNAFVGVDAPGTYTIMVSDTIAPALCPARQDFVVPDVFNTPVAQLDTTGSPCQGSVEINAIIEPAGGNYSIEWFRNDTTTNVTGTIFVANDPSLSGIYTVQVTDLATGCTYPPQAPLQVDVFTPVTVFANADFACDDGSAVRIEAVSSLPDVTFEWTNPAGLPIQGVDTSVIFESVPGTYGVRVITTDGCVATATAELTLFPLPPSDLDNTPRQICTWIRILRRIPWNWMLTPTRCSAPIPGP